MDQKIIVGGLVFSLDPFSQFADAERWTASLPWESQGHYQVSRWRERWTYRRPDHPTLGLFAGDAIDRDEGLACCAEDFVIVSRLHAWTEYMKTHDPPGFTAL